MLSENIHCTQELSGPARRPWRLAASQVQRHSGCTGLSWPGSWRPSRHTWARTFLGTALRASQVSGDWFHSLQAASENDHRHEEIRIERRTQAHSRQWDFGPLCWEAFSCEERLRGGTTCVPVPGQWSHREMTSRRGQGSTHSFARGSGLCFSYQEAFCHPETICQGKGHILTSSHSVIGDVDIVVAHLESVFLKVSVHSAEACAILGRADVRALKSGVQGKRIVWNPLTIVKVTWSWQCCTQVRMFVERHTSVRF